MAAAVGRQQGVTCRRKSFADLGASRAVVDALAARGHRRRPSPFSSSSCPTSCAGRDVLVKSPDRVRARRSPSGCPIVDRIEADGSAPDRAGARPDPRAGRQIVEEHAAAGARPRAVRRRRLRRRRHRAPGQARPPRPHPRGHPRPPRGPDRARRRQPRPRPHPGARRGRPHARHGLPARRRPHRRRLPRDRQTLFFSATLDGERRPHRPRVHARRAPATSTPPAASAAGDVQPPLRRRHATTRSSTRSCASCATTSAA